MTLVVTSSGRSSRERVCRDALQDLQGQGTAGSIAAIGTLESGYATLGGAGTVMLNNTGAGTAIVRDAPTGARLFQLVSSGATRVVMSANSGYGCSTIGYQFAGAGAPSLASLRPLRRYTWRVSLRATVRGAAVAECGAVQSNGLLTLLGSDTGIVWSSDPAVNGGNWTPRYRLVAAGAVTTGADSGIPFDATFRELAVRFTEGASPLLELLIDEEPLFSLSGLANMPASSASNAHGLGYGWSQVAGSTMQAAAARFTVEDIG
jgi:hypothetical protein